MRQAQTPEQYRRESRRLRLLAEAASTDATRRELLGIAEQFEGLAESTELAAKYYGRQQGT
jgi:hypothetical protein